MTEISIMSAQHGGYIVFGNREIGMFSSPLFAGDLVPVMDFVTRHLMQATAKPAADPELMKFDPSRTPIRAPGSLRIDGGVP